MSRPNVRGYFLIAAVWALVIFTTSCTFISRRVFIQCVRQFIPSAMLQQAWMSLWSEFGCFIVKGYHVAEFALLCYLLFTGLRQSLFRRSLDAAAVSAILSILYAASDEWHQTFVPGRGGTVIDVGIDCIGIFIITACVLWRNNAAEVSVASSLGKG